MSDGQRAWGGRVLDLPDDSTPSGRGFRSNQQYFLPLSTAAVVAIDLDAGKITHVSKSRRGDVPGNLICHQGNVVSLGLEGMEAYYQRDAALAEVGRRLEANPDDAEALSLRGEIAVG